MMAAFYDEKLKPLNLHDWGSESAETVEKGSDHKVLPVLVSTLK